MIKKSSTRVVHEIPPNIYKEAKILILGSMPSVKSRQEGFYYMHPQNRFWLVLSKLLNADFVNASIDEKKKLLKRKKIALYDVISSCDIIGSLDSKITNVVLNPIDIYIKGTNIEKIFLNGQKAKMLFKRHFPKLVEMATFLPSTSSTNASYRLDDLVKSWQVITNYLD